MRLSRANVESLKSLDVQVFDVETNTEYRTFSLTSWNGSERYYRRAGDAIRRMRDGNEPYFMHGIKTDGEMVLIAAN